MAYIEGIYTTGGKKKKTGVPGTGTPVSVGAGAPGGEVKAVQEPKPRTLYPDLGTESLRQEQFALRRYQSAQPAAKPEEVDEDGWPVMGCNGNPVIVHEKPHGPSCERTGEQASDAFEGKLGLQWQFMGNWREDFFSLDKPGTLRLYAHACGKNLWQCPQALTQKVACPAFTAEVQLDASSLLAGEQAGLALIGGQYAYAAIRHEEDGFHLVYVQNAGQHANDQLLVSTPVSTPSVTLRMTLKPTGYDQAEAAFAFSTDGEHFSPIGSPFSPERHTWVGARCALMCMPYDRKGNVIGSAAFGPFAVTKGDAQ